MNVSKNTLKLYAVTDSQWLNGRPLSQAVEEAIIGGATFIQLREKQLATPQLVTLAREVKAVTDRLHIPFVINDDVHAALAVDACGVHVGQEDMQAQDVRRLLGADKILGVSAQTVEQARLAEANGADYLGVGAVFSTSTKKDAAAVSYDTLRAICQSVKIPVIAIGGINASNIANLRDSGIVGIAAVSAIFAAQDISAAARALNTAVSRIL